MWQVNYSDELYHHGIKGQKWGIRRYQNEDGTLTPEGEKRYNIYQFERDREIYGTPGATRIQKHVLRNQYSSVEGARQHERKRLEEYRAASKRVAKVGATLGYINGVAGAVAIKKYIEKKTGAGAGLDLKKQLLIYNASGTASALVSASLARVGAMAIGGYNPVTQMKDKKVKN